jgi:hypothetical protein
MVIGSWEYQLSFSLSDPVMDFVDGQRDTTADKIGDDISSSKFIDRGGSASGSSRRMDLRWVIRVRRLSCQS